MMRLKQHGWLYGRPVGQWRKRRTFAARGALRFGLDIAEALNQFGALSQSETFPRGAVLLIGFAGRSSLVNVRPLRTTGVLRR